MSHPLHTPSRQTPWLRVIDRHMDIFLTLGLLVAALVLFTVNLGGVPLRDWDEGTVAQVAREIAQSPRPWIAWLYPTLHGDPYFNKPPLVHGLVAIAYHFGGIGATPARLPGAWLTALSVPLLYGIGRQLFPQRLTALLAAAVYLTMLPVVRHGRLAMLDGAILCFFLGTVWAALRSRRNPRWALGMGLGIGLMTLTKGILGLLLGGIALAFLAWDAPRLLISFYTWGGLFLGALPALIWYALQGLAYGPEFFTVHFLSQSFDRVWAAVEDNRQPPWFYLLELLKYGFPWLLFWPMGLGLAWGDRTLSWAKLVLVWGGGYLLVISVMGTKLPWYVLPVYPALALATGYELGRLWQTLPGVSARLEPSRRYVAGLRAGLALLGILGWGGGVYFLAFATPREGDLALALAALGLTMTVAVWLMNRRDRQFIPILLWGFYVTLLLFVTSNHWVWELNEDYAVEPVAAMVQAHTPENQRLLTSHPIRRPSLEFYSDREVIPASRPQLRQRWQRQNAPYFLLDRATALALNLPQAEVLAETQDWLLITKRSEN
ncbi:MAG: glycosyltransferase family 39 protein [Synechococcales bacterium]|nr:glycosyltransferase family 39 protein [Synechococcales bacterium]